MTHNIALITTLAMGFGVALALGFLAEKLKLPALVGYLLAGVAIGPHTPGFVADITIASQLSEVGIMLLMFGVGLHFSLNDLLAVKRIAIPGALVQMATATLCGWILARYWDWPWGSALLFGLSLSCASTVVLLKSLEKLGLFGTMNGRIAIGWLVVQDLATVQVLVLLPPLAMFLGDGASDVNLHSVWDALGETLFEIVSFLVLMLVIGRRILPWLLWQVTRTGSRELFTLSVISSAIGIAYGASAVFSVSAALGAFIAGTVMSESEFSHRAAEESLPFRDAFSVLFFVSIGMLFDPNILVDQPLKVLGTIAVIVLGNSLPALLLVLLLRYPLNTGLTVAASLGQIGEFSIILASLATGLGILPQEGMSLILAGVLISIAMNALLFAGIEPARRWVVRHSDFARQLEQRQDPYAELPMSTERRYLQGQVVLVGIGRVGKRIADALDAHAIPYVVAEQNRELVEDLRARGIPAVSGNAADPAVLIQAHIAQAAMLVIATPDSLNVRQMAETARLLNPGVEIILRTHNEEESNLLRQEKVGAVFYGEEELANGMSNHVLARFIPECVTRQLDH